MHSEHLSRAAESPGCCNQIIMVSPFLVSGRTTRAGRSAVGHWSLADMLRPPNCAVVLVAGRLQRV